MKGRIFAGFLAVISLVLLLPLPAASQAQTPTPDATAPRTPAGRPDLQGVWTSGTLTRLERPEKYAGQAFLSEEDVAALEREAATRKAFSLSQEFVDDTDPVTGRPLTQIQPGQQFGVGTYSPQYFDGGTRIAPSGRTSLIVDPPDGRIPYLQATHRYQREYGAPPYDSHVDLDTGERCLGDGPLETLWFGYNPNHQIVQTANHVVILHEMYRERRIIPIDAGAHVDADIRQWNGDIRGHWEGATLVVESTNFVDRWQDYRFNEVWRAPSDTLHLVERFTRLDAEMMVYQVTITDPAKFASPWTVETYLTTNQAAAGVTQGPIYEFACHEGNYGARNILTGARATEGVVKTANNDTTESK